MKTVNLRKPIKKEIIILDLNLVVMNLIVFVSMLALIIGMFFVR